MTKVISISDEAYEELARIKNGFSFSKIILLLTDEKKKDSLMKFAGIFSEKEANTILKELEKERKTPSRRMR